VRILKLNIGCGKSYDPEYYNIDLYDNVLADEEMSILNLKFDENSVDEIKSIHVIEHLTYFEVIYAFSEIFRVLKQNGKLIIETPNLNKSCQDFIDSNEKQKKIVLGWLYGVPDKGLQHKLCFPKDLLLELLENVGFMKISIKNFYNQENIPTMRVECHKNDILEEYRAFQMIAQVRKKLFLTELIKFDESYLIKEQEDLIIFSLINLLSFFKTNDEKKIHEMMVFLILRWPIYAKILTDEIYNQNLISKTKIKHTDNIIKIISQFDLPNILLYTLKGSSIFPNTQDMVFNSVISLAEEIIKGLYYKVGIKGEILKKLKDLQEKVKIPEISIFTAKVLEKKSLFYFYSGIKNFYRGEYHKSFNKLLTAIKLHRNNFFFYWNLAKVLFKLEKEQEAVQFYKYTLRCINLTDVKYKKLIRKDVKRERDWIKKKIGKIPKFEPITSISNYHHDHIFNS